MKIFSLLCALQCYASTPDPENDYIIQMINTYNDSKKMITASYEGRLDDVRRYLKRSADIHFVSYEPYRFFMPPHIFEYLEQGICHTNKGNTALLYASSQGHTEIVAYLLQHGADIEHQTIYHYTALYQAVCHDQIDTLRCLLQHGASIKKTADACWYPLHEAASLGYLNIVQCLVEHDPRHINVLTCHPTEMHTNSTPLKLAADEGHDDVVAYLKSKGGLMWLM